MNERRVDEGQSAHGRFPAGRRLGRRPLAWGAAAAGAALVALGAVLQTNAGGQTDVSVVRASMWAFAGGCALCAVALQARRPGRAAGASAAEAPAAGSDDFLLPLLGALLVYRYQVLSEGQLRRALEQQRSEGRNGRRLGDILLEMKLVSATQLRKALDYQQMEAARKRAARAGPAVRADGREGASRAL